MELLDRRPESKENDTEGLNEISNGAKDLAENSNGGKKGKVEESGSKDLAEISKNLGAKEAEETEDLVKRKQRWTRNEDKQQQRSS